MAKAKFNLKNPKSKEETPIFMFFSFDGQRLKYSTGEAAKPTLWNKATQRLKGSASGALELNEQLDKLAENVRKAYRGLVNEGGMITPEILRDKLDLIRNGKSNKHTLLSFIEHFIDSVKTSRSKATIVIYNNALAHLKGFQEHTGKPIDFQHINLDFYNDFLDYLVKEKKFATNTVGKVIKTLKTFLNEATERGINAKVDFKSKRFKVTTEDAESIYLNEDEIRNIHEIDLSKNEKLDRTRDLFIVGCWTGLRFSDFTQITPQNIKNGFISVITQKTGEPVSVPIHPMVKTIMEKYKDRYENSLPPPISNQHMNENLKDIGIAAKLEEEIMITQTKGGMKVKKTFAKHELITTHTARRSFATNLYMAGFPAISIMKITGHRTEKAFLRYIKIKPQENAIKLQEFWNSKESKLQAV